MPAYWINKQENAYVKPHELEHALRAAGRILDEKRFYVVGSQSILGAFPDAPEGFTRSNSPFEKSREVVNLGA
jgi:hypothetical protein